MSKGRYKLSLILLCWVACIVNIYGQSWGSPIYNVWNIYAFGAYGFNQNPKQEITWTKYKIPGNNEYYFDTKDIPLCDSSGDIKVIVDLQSGLVRNAKYERLTDFFKPTTLPEATDDGFYGFFLKGVEPNTYTIYNHRAIKNHDGDSSGCFQLTFRENEQGLVDTAWATPIPLEKLNVEPGLLDRHVIIDNEVWWFNYPEYPNLSQDSLYIFRADNKGVIKLMSTLKFDLSDYTENMPNSTFILRHIAENHQIIAELRYVKTVSPFASKTTEKLVRLQLNDSWTEIDSISLIDSFIFHYGKAPRSNLEQSALSENGRYLYAALRKSDQSWRNRRDELIDNEHIQIWQYDLKNGDKQQIFLENRQKLDTIRRFSDMAMLPDGQIYVSGKVDSLPYPYHNNFLGKIAFPNKDADSVYFFVDRDRGDYNYKEEERYCTACLIFGHSFVNQDVPHIKYQIETSCQEDQVLIKNKSPDLFTKFAWYFLRFQDSTLVDSAFGYEPTISLPESGKYFVKAMGQSNKGLKSWRWDYFTYIKKPRAQFDSTSQIGCQWAKISFKNRSIADTFFSKNALWEFELEDSIALSSNDMDPTLSFERSGQYDLRMVYSNGFCNDTLRRENFLTIRKAAQPGFSISDTFICSPDTIMLSDQIQGKYDSVEYRWNDGLIQTRNNPSRKIDSLGNYKIVQRVFSENGCATQDSAHFRAARGVESKPNVAINRVSVRSDSSIVVDIMSSPWAKSILLKSESAEYGTYLDSLSPNTHTFVDDRNKPNYNPVHYKIRVVDSCFQVSSPSNSVSSIYLNSQNINNSAWVANWNKTRINQDSTLQYILQQKLYSPRWETLAPLNETPHQRRVSFSEGDTVFWRVLATDGRDTANSNVNLSIPTTPIFVPNAFTPNGDGLNDVFRISDFGIKDFKATVWSSSGQILAVSKSPKSIWDGLSKNGEPYSLGSYAYLIEIETETGKFITKQGNILLLR